MADQISGSTIINFGRHKTKTFEQVMTEEHSYCDWVRQVVNPSGDLAVFQKYLTQRQGAAPRPAQPAVPVTSERPTVRSAATPGSAKRGRDERDGVGQAAPAPSSAARSVRSDRGAGAEVPRGETELTVGKYEGKTFRWILTHKPGFAVWSLKQRAKTDSLKAFQAYVRSHTAGGAVTAGSELRELSARKDKGRGRHADSNEEAEYDGDGDDEDDDEDSSIDWDDDDDVEYVGTVRSPGTGVAAGPASARVTRSSSARDERPSAAVRSMITLDDVDTEDDGASARVVGTARRAAPGRGHAAPGGGAAGGAGLVAPPIPRRLPASSGAAAAPSLGSAAGSASGSQHVPATQPAAGGQSAGSAVGAASASQATIEERLRAMEAQLAEEKSKREELEQCPICMDGKKGVAFQCGHVVCKPCSTQVKECPFCKAKITKRSAVFL